MKDARSSVFVGTLVGTAEGNDSGAPPWQHPPSPTPPHMIGYAGKRLACATVAEMPHMATRIDLTGANTRKISR